MGEPADEGASRHIEVHFATDDEAIEFETADEPAAADALIAALDASNVDEAKRMLEERLPTHGILRRGRRQP